MRTRAARKRLIMDNLVSKEEGVRTKEITEINMEGTGQEDLTKTSEDLVKMREVPAKGIIERIEALATKGVPEDNLAPNPTEGNLVLNQETNQKKE